MKFSANECLSPAVAGEKKMFFSFFSIFKTQTNGVCEFGLNE